MSANTAKGDHPDQKIMRTPRHVDVEITSRCNLQCRYCYFFNNPRVDYRELPTADWLQFFDELGRLAVMHVTLTGGEPFIRNDLPELIERIVRNRMRFSIFSNGALIDDEFADFIAGTGRCDYVQVSIDGASPETHDACRGQGSFEGAIRGIQTLQQHLVPATARVTIHRHNVRDLKNIARLLLEVLKLPGFSTNSAGYLGSCRYNADDVLLTTQERQLAMKTLQSLSKEYGSRISADAGPLTEARLWRRMEDARVKGAQTFPNGGRLSGCGCSLNKISVRADGAIIPCSMLPHMELGRINHDSLKDVWQHNLTLIKLRRRQAIPLTEFDFCAGCDYLPYCTGNCPGLAYTLTGQVDHPSPDACLRHYLQNGGRLP